uniref:sphingosine kinase n=2 Tax=Clastoptera arizonana TaxID=38151 RepID=A0A1B6DK62_9HEMI
MMNPIEEVNISIKPMLEETFYILSKKNTVYRVKLTEKGITLQKESNGNIKTETISLNDIIGCRCMRSKRRSEQSCACHPSSSRNNDPRVVDENSLDKDESDISAYLYIYAYVLKNYKVKSGRKRERMTITLRFRSYDRYEDNMKEAQKWKSSINHLIKSQYITNLSPAHAVGSDIVNDNKILVILNPKSGVGKARDVFQSKVVPILTEADVEYDLHVTKHAQDAREQVRIQNIYKYGGGIVVLGGDGILYEVINGLMERPDWEKALEKMKLGIIPCGSGNGLAKAINFAYNEPHDQNPVLISTLNVAKGFSTPMDLVRIQSNSQVVYSFLSVGWGFLSDVDIESERLRALGSPRFTLWSMARLIGLRTYQGRLSFIRIPEEKEAKAKENNDNVIEKSFRDSNTTLQHSSSCGDSLDLETDDSESLRRDSFYSITSRKSTYHSTTGSSYQSLVDDKKPEIKMYGPPSTLPELSQPVPQTWQVYQGDFIMVHASYQSHIAIDCMIAPYSKLADGIIWLSVIRKGISRTHLLQYLLSLSSGSHILVPNTEHIPVSAFRLEPQCTGSVITVDGEVIEHGPFQAEVMPGLINVMSHSS